MDDDGSIWNAFGVIGQPSFAFVRSDGSVETFVGGLPKELLVDEMSQLAASS